MRHHLIKYALIYIHFQDRRLNIEQKVLQADRQVMGEKERAIHPYIKLLRH